MTGTGFTASITLERENLVFFAVPYDPGFSATVNGEPAQVLEVDGGLMAVACPAGQNEIVFTYQAVGIREARYAALVCAVLFAAYLGVSAYRRRRRRG